MKQITLIGSTGSIGKNALEVMAQHPGEFSVFAIAAKNNVDDLVIQARRFHPRFVSVFDPEKKNELERKLAVENLNSIKVLSGREGLNEIATHPEVDQVLLALAGSEGLFPLFAAIRAKKSIALANKEPLVTAGGLIRDLARAQGVEIIPIDSEHSGVFQCLSAGTRDEISRIFITASGGPFLDRNLSTFDAITPEEAIQHPRWSMGKKISVDSATLMNKGLEVIEASVLFDLPLDQIEVLVHPQSLVHAIVEFRDGSQIAQMSVTDMKIPIQFALSYPKRFRMDGLKLDLARARTLQFMKVEPERFPCLALAYEAARRGGTATCVLNASNEVCVEAFLNKEITFTDIPKMIQAVLSQHIPISHPNLDEILKADEWARCRTHDLIESKVIQR